MDILLCAPDRDPQPAIVEDENWVTAAINAAWAWCRHTASSPVTAHEANTAGKPGPRIATVSCEIHDE